MTTSEDANIAQALLQIAKMQPKAAAVIAKERLKWRSWSFEELAKRCERHAAALHQAGIGQGEKVMLMLPPSMDFIALSFALFQLGAVVILIDPGMGYRNLLRCIGSVRPQTLIGVKKAILFSRLFPASFASLRRRFCVGASLPGLGFSLHRLPANASPPSWRAGEEDAAAIIFTTGSTGPPKGVRYSHGVFAAQLRLIKHYYHIGPGQVDQPGFPLFGLFSTALGACAVLPDMDASRPAKVNPRRFVDSIVRYGVSYSFGSPAIWEVVSRYCLQKGIVLPLNKVLMAGAPVSGELIARMQRILSAESQIFTPYGATESLPVASIEGREMLEQTWPLTQEGKGVCVGKALPEMRIAIIKARDGAFSSWDETKVLAPGEIGEIVVQGPVVTRAYEHNEAENRLAKIPAGALFWHRMGDMGYLDEQERLWFCGRKAHRVLTAKGAMYSVCCEAIFNRHPRLRRSALVGLGPVGMQRPVLVVETNEKILDSSTLFRELRLLAATSPLTEEITTFLIHPSFPVDIRHNAKIFREQLASWAERKLGRDSTG